MRQPRVTQTYAFFFQWRWIFKLLWTLWINWEGFIYWGRMSFETGSNPQVNSSNLLCATYATFLAYLKDAINIPSVRWYFHWLETTLTDGLFAWKKGSLGDGELNNCIHNYSKTKTERKKCKKMQTILHGGCYLLFEGYLQEKKNRFLSWVDRVEE